MWICTKDHCTPDKNNEFNREGTTSPYFDKVILEEKRKEGKVLRWLTKDDDRNLCHEGDWCYTKHEDSNELFPLDEFQPLDDLSMPDVGAVHIFIKNEETGEWDII